MKKIFAAALALAMMFTAVGCNSITSSTSDTSGTDADVAVATIGDREVAFSEYKQLFDLYAGYYAMMGYDISTDEEATQQLQDDVIDALVLNEIIAYQAAEAGFNQLSEEKLAEIEKNAQEDLESIVEECKAQAESDAEDDSSVNVEERTAEYVADQAESYAGERMTADEFGEWIQENYIENAIGEAFREEMVRDVTVSDSSIQSWYDENLEQQKADYDEDPEGYKSAKETEELYGGSPVLYTPEGYSRVLEILITPTDAISEEYSNKFDEMQNLESEYGELAFTVQVEGGTGAARLNEIKKEYKAAKAEADKLLDEYFKPSVEKANEAYAKLQAGEKFEDVAAEYSDETNAPEKGLLISQKSSSYDWSDEIKAAFAKLKLGEYTKPIKDDNGVHILYYLSDEPAGEIPLDDVKDAIRELLLDDAQQEEWNQMLETWKNDGSVSLNEELIRSVAYNSSEPVG